jgi:hypothetical protein
VVKLVGQIDVTGWHGGSPLLSLLIVPRLAKIANGLLSANDSTELAQTLRLAGMAGQLEDAVVVLCGPMENQREQTDRRRDERAAVFSTTRTRVAEHPVSLNG